MGNSRVTQQRQDLDAVGSARDHHVDSRQGVGVDQVPLFHRDNVAPTEQLERQTMPGVGAKTNREPPCLMSSPQTSGLAVARRPPFRRRNPRTLDR